MKIFFVFISSLTGFFIGSFLASATLPKESGLAGGPTILFYGLIGLVISIIVSIFLIKKIERQLLKKITIILVILNLIPIGWIIYRVVSQTTQIKQEEQPKKLTPTEISGSLISLILKPSQKSYNNTEMGLGMVKPDFYNKKTLYFYGMPNLEKPANEHTPFDSIVFTQSEHHQFDISYAPPWFYPEHLKLDYDILYFKLLAMNRDWINVELNKQTEYSVWMLKSDVTVLLWPEFLLNIFSVEILDPRNNLLRIKPLSNASEVVVKEYEFLAPVMAKDSWIKVRLINKELDTVGEAWLQWQSGGKLLISYSLLS